MYGHSHPQRQAVQIPNFQCLTEAVAGVCTYLAVDEDPEAYPIHPSRCAI